MNDPDPNEELHERTVLALEHAREAGTPEEDLRLLCYHAGINYEREIEHVEG